MCARLRSVRQAAGSRTSFVARCAAGVLVAHVTAWAQSPPLPTAATAATAATSATAATVAFDDAARAVYPAGGAAEIARCRAETDGVGCLLRARWASQAE